MCTIRLPADRVLRDKIGNLLTRPVAPRCFGRGRLPCRSREGRPRGPRRRHRHLRDTARVTIGDKVFTLHENESTYVPVGSVHRLENPGHIPLDLIEVQTGKHFGEDDIIRIHDDYGR